MKITTSFSRPAGWMAPYIAGACFVLACAALVVAVVLSVSAYRIRGEMPALEKRLARYANREVPVTADLPPHDKLVTLQMQVKALNGLAGTAGQSLPLLFTHLEKLIPDKAWIVNLQYRSREGETRLLAEADQAETLTQFMERLEQSGYFAQVLLTRQSQRTKGARHTVQFEIQLKEKS